MYHVNDIVLYGMQGVCTIEEISEMCFGKNSDEYYVLRPVYDDKSTIFVPMHNESLTGKMRAVLSAQEIFELINAMPDEDQIWIENDAERKEEYKSILVNGTRDELIKLIKTLYLRKQELKQKGKKLHVADEHFLKEAEKLLYEEFAHVLKIKREQVLPFIMKQIQVEGR